MKKLQFHLPLLGLIAITLTACTGSIFPHQGAPTAPLTPAESFENQQMAEAGITEASTLTVPTSEGPIGGNAVARMDGLDCGKLYKALDNPIGKSARWKNGMSGIEYTVTPTQKIVMSGNPFCRRYHVSAESSSGSNREFDGTACVSSDGNWHSV